MPGKSQQGGLAATAQPGIADLARVHGFGAKAESLQAIADKRLAATVFGGSPKAAGSVLLPVQVLQTWSVGINCCLAVAHNRASVQSIYIS